MKRFVTKTNEKKVAKYNLVTFAVLLLIPWALLIAVSLMQEPPAWDLIGLCSAGFVPVGIILAFQMKTNNVFTLTFDGNVIYFDGKTKKAHYRIFDIPASDIVLKQSNADKAANCCSLRIKNTIFNLKYVENYSELKKYIDENFPKR